MAKRTRGIEAPGGMSLSTRLTLIMTLALAAVMTGAAVALFKTATRQTTAAQEHTLGPALRHRAFQGVAIDHGAGQPELAAERIAELGRREGGIEGGGRGHLNSLSKLDGGGSEWRGRGL